MKFPKHTQLLEKEEKKKEEKHEEKPIEKKEEKKDEKKPEEKKPAVSVENKVKESVAKAADAKPTPAP